MTYHCAPSGDTSTGSPCAGEHNASEAAIADFLENLKPVLEGHIGGSTMDQIIGDDHLELGGQDASSRLESCPSWARVKWAGHGTVEIRDIGERASIVEPFELGERLSKNTELAGDCSCWRA